jgi:hypothetical protein
MTENMMRKCASCATQKERARAHSMGTLTWPVPGQCWRGTQPVAVRALHAIRYTAGRSFAVAADQRRAVALQGERLEDGLDSRPTLHNVVFHPGNSDFAVLGIDWPATWVLGASPGTTGRSGVVLLRSRISAVRGCLVVNVSGAGDGEVGCWQRATRTPENVIRATVWEPGHVQCRGSAGAADKHSEKSEGDSKRCKSEGDSKRCSGT